MIYQELTRYSCADTDVESGEASSVTTDHAMITDLNPTAEYCVGVAASTAAGVGNYSQSLLPGKIERTKAYSYLRIFFIIVAVHTNFLFQVHFHGVHNCPQWVVSLKSIVQQVLCLYSIYEHSMELVVLYVAEDMKTCFCPYIVERCQT